MAMYCKEGIRPAETGTQLLLHVLHKQHKNNSITLSCHVTGLKVPADVMTFSWWSE